MHVLIVYESMYGNTKLIAEAIGRGLTAQARVDITEAAVAPTEMLRDVDLLVAGGPTHAFSMSRPKTRRDARTDGATGSTGTGIREWIDGLGNQQVRVPIATFDTKVAKPRLPGSAARSAQRKLHRLGCPVFASARTFLVDGKRGPLLAGQEEAATAWGQRLAAQLSGQLPRR